MSTPQIPSSSIPDGGVLLADLASAAYASANTASRLVYRDADGKAAFSQLTIEDAPVASTDAVNKAYADALAGGLNPDQFKPSVRVATAAALPAYTRTDNVITAGANGALPAIDGVTLTVAQELLLTQGADASDNGIYVVTAVGDAGNPFVLTRRADANQDAEVQPGLFVMSREGTAYTRQGWVLSGSGALTLNTDPLVFIEYSPATNLTAGTALAVTGSVINHTNVLTLAGGVAGTYPLCTIAVNAQGHITAATKFHIKNASGDFTGGELTIATGLTNIVPDPDGTHPALFDLFINGIRWQQYTAGPDASVNLTTGVVTLSTAAVAGTHWEARALRAY